jgi:hypothetical protein
MVCLVSLDAGHIGDRLLSVRPLMVLGEEFPRTIRVRRRTCLEVLGPVKASLQLNPLVDTIFPKHCRTRGF